MIYEQGKKAARVIAEGKEVAQIWAEGKKVFQHIPSGGVMELEFVFTETTNLWLDEALGNDVYGVTNALVDFGDGSEPVYISSAAGIDKSILRHRYEAGSYTVTIYGWICYGKGGESGAACNKYLYGVKLPTNNSPIKRLRDFSFSESKFETVPVALFSNAVEETSFLGVFSNCENMKSAPKDIFRYNVNAEVFDYAFAANGITSIQEGWFAYNKKAKSFERTFAFSIEYDSIPNNILANQTNVTNLSFAFYHRNIALSKTGPSTGTLPTLWTKFPNAEHNSCFGYWLNATNYAEAKAAGWG